MLLEMGYTLADARIALQVSGNSLEGACTFLINNPQPSLNMNQAMPLLALDELRRLDRQRDAQSQEQPVQAAA